MELEEDESRFETVLRFPVHNVSSLKEPEESLPHSFRNLTWRIQVMPPTIPVKGKQQQSCSCIFLQCDGDPDSRSWSCYATAELQLLNQHGGKSFTRNIRHLFHASDNESGISVPWHDVLDPQMGYIKYDKIILEAHVQVDQSRPEATFHYRLQNVHKLSKKKVSPPCYIRNLPWRIAVIPRVITNKKYLSVFLECNGDSTSTSWSCFAKGEFTLLSSRTDREPYTRAIRHLFCTEEKDWGFSTFMLWNDVLAPRRGHVRNGSITIEAHVEADAPVGIAWDSRRFTGYVGLKSQRVTSKLNSTLQILYFTTYLRKAVYKIPTEYDDSRESIALAIQKVLHQLQFSPDPVRTNHLTRCFGWETSCLLRHNNQSLLKIILDKLKTIMKGSSVEGTVSKLFEGEFISCLNCEGTEHYLFNKFYEIELDIKGQNNIEEALKNYMATRLIESVKHYSREYKLQTTGKSIGFYSLPPVLHFQIRRFQYFPTTNCSIKFNGKFEFYEKINLERSEIIQEKTISEYILHAIVVHSGDSHGGHYILYIDPKCDGNWYRFDDEVVSSCSKQEAIMANYGGHGEGEDEAVKICTNACMLVYILESELEGILQEVRDDDIPPELAARIQSDQKLEQIQRKERIQSYLYMVVKVLLEDSFDGHQGIGLCDPDNAKYLTFRVTIQTTLKDLLKIFSDYLKYPVQQLRPWLLSDNEDQMLRPVFMDVDANLHARVIDLADDARIWSIFLEVIPPDSSLKALPPFNVHTDVLLFFRLYVPKCQRMDYLGHQCMPLTTTMDDLISLLCKRANFSSDTRLLVFKEKYPGLIKKINICKDSLFSVVGNKMQVVIILFQRADEYTNNLPTCDLWIPMEILFCNIAYPNDIGFIMKLPKTTNYKTMVKAVAQKLRIDPAVIQFFMPCNDTSEVSIHRVHEDTLMDLIHSCKLNQPMIYYHIFGTTNCVRENGKQIRCVWVSASLEGRELILSPRASETVADLLYNAKKEMESVQSRGENFRFTEIHKNKIVRVHRNDTLLESLDVTRTYRIEEIVQDEENIADDEVLVPVAHFQQNVLCTFGIPFLLKVKQRECFSAVKDRIQSKLGIPDEEYETYKFAMVIMNWPRFICEDSDMISFTVFKGCLDQEETSNTTPWLGLEHFNCARGSEVERNEI